LGSSFFGLLKFKIGLEAFKSWALIMGLNFFIYLFMKFYYINPKKNFRPFGPDRLDFQACRALPNIEACRGWSWVLI
jgi:hypothetical protein